MRSRSTARAGRRRAAAPPAQSAANRSDPPGTDPPGTDPPGTDPPGTEPPGTELPGTAKPAGTAKPPGTAEPPNTAELPGTAEWPDTAESFDTVGPPGTAEPPEPPEPPASGWQDTAEWQDRPERPAWADRRLLYVLAAVIIVAAMVAVPLGAYDSASCREPGDKCARRSVREPGGRPRPLRPVTPLEAATQGRYVALGDSYSSGEGVYDERADRALNTGRDRCHRSRRAFYTTITQTYRFARGSEFWACAGLRTANALTGQYGGRPQVTRVDARTSLITITLGGNDAGFSPVLVRCIVKIPWSSACRDQQPEVERRLADLRGDLARVIGRLTANAPYARLLVLGYPRPFPAEPGGRVDNLSAADQRWVNDMTGRLNQVIRDVAREADRRIVATGGRGSVEFVDVVAGFGGHEIGTPDPYLNGLNVDIKEIAARPQSYHPTAAGYRQFAVLVDRQIKAGPGRRINQYR